MLKYPFAKAVEAEEPEPDDSKRHFNLWQHLEQVPHQPDVRDLEDRRLGILVDRHDRAGVLDAGQVLDRRSEEHTSELQSLMRISYAVFCLKKKKTITSREK